MKNKKSFKSGFAAIIGMPNVGKSTLLNTIVGQKIAIISDKPQTTRNKILATCTIYSPSLLCGLCIPGVSVNIICSSSVE